MSTFFPSVLAMLFLSISWNEFYATFPVQGMKRKTKSQLEIYFYKLSLLALL
jgi:hypothetical protein